VREEMFGKAVSAIHARINGEKLKRLYVAAERIAAVKKANKDD
jgi:hypothetical protein